MRLSVRDVVLTAIVAAALFLAWPFLMSGVVWVLDALSTLLFGDQMTRATTAAVERENAQYAIPALAVIIVGFGVPVRRRLVFGAVLLGGLLAFDLAIAMAGVDWFVVDRPNLAVYPFRTVATLFVFHTFDVVWSLAVPLAMFVTSGRETARSEEPDAG